MKGLDMLGSFFDLISTLCTPAAAGVLGVLAAIDDLVSICKYLPKFGLVWNQPGNATRLDYPTCNIHGCQCFGHALDPAKKFFWFGLWVPPSPPGMVGFTWSGGGICISLRVDSAGSGIEPGTGVLKFELKLFDVIGNFIGPAKKKILEAACKIVLRVSVGFSIDHSLYLTLEGQPPLLVNARRRNTDVATAGNTAGTDQYTSSKEYFWGCKYHAEWAFPNAVSADPYCSSIKANIWFQLVIGLPNVLKTSETKPAATSVSGDADQPFDIADLFKFEYDVQLLISADNPSTLQEDVTNALSPILAYTLFKLLLVISFSIMMIGGVVLKLQLNKFSGGLFADWMIKLASQMCYMRKGSTHVAFYLTYSLGEAANDMGLLPIPFTPNMEAGKSVVVDLYKNFAKPDVGDLMKNEGVDVPATIIPTGVQVQAYGIITGCTGTFPNAVCNLNSNTVGFGFKVAVLLGNSNGFSAFLEKPLSNPQDAKSDTLAFCIADLKETEPACINLGFLLWLLDCLLAIANIILAVSQAIGQAIESLGKFLAAAANALCQAVSNCCQPSNNWIRRRSWCNDYPRRRNTHDGKWCWGYTGYSDCGKEWDSWYYGATPFPLCRYGGINPMCYMSPPPTRRRRDRRRRKLNAGGGCVQHYHCNSNKCQVYKTGGNWRCCTHTYTWVRTYCSNLNNNENCAWGEQCKGGWCSGKKCGSPPNRRRRRRTRRRRGTRRRRWW
jgi:hypothetical protein